MFSKVLFLVMLCLYLREIAGKRYLRGIRNVAFDSQKLLVSKLATINEPSLIKCSIYCAAAPTCISLHFNKQSGTCILFELDFTNISSTATQFENGWRYFHVGRDYDKSLRSRCVSTAPTSDICSMFCLHYVHDGTASHADFTSMCSQLDGGEMVKIDRGLKQHCVERLLANISVDFVFIQGKRNDISAAWKYDDGTNITFFNWNIPWGQPDSRIDELYITLRKTNNYLWHDVHDFNVYAAVCQQN